MPCFCWIDDCEISEEMKIIRDHMRLIVEQMKIIHGKGDLYPNEKSTPLPRHILEDVTTLMYDMFHGKCSEKESQQAD